MSFGESDDTQETEDVPPLAASVETLQEAVQLSIKDGLSKDCLFRFARAIKAFEITHDRRLPPAELQAAFAQWWNAAKPLLPPDAEFDEYRFDFEDTFAKTHAALGANSLEEAIRRADSKPMPPQATRYASPKLKRLVAVCYHLQQLQGSSPFFLGVRAAAKIGGAKGLPQASAWLAGLVRDGILTVVEKGTRKRATRFQFNLPESAPVGDTNAAERAKAALRNVSRQPLPPAGHLPSKAPGTPASRKLSTYELAERKKALHELIKGFPTETDFDHHTQEEAKRLRKLNAKLRQVNSLLAGVE